MLCCVVLCCVMLYCIVLCCAVLCYTAMCCIVLYCIVLNCCVLCCAILYCTVSLSNLVLSLPVTPLLPPSNSPYSSLSFPLPTPPSPPLFPPHPILYRCRKVSLMFIRTERSSYNLKEKDMCVGRIVYLHNSEDSKTEVRVISK